MDSAVATVHAGESLSEGACSVARHSSPHIYATAVNKLRHSDVVGVENVQVKDEKGVTTQEGMDARLGECFSCHCPRIGIASVYCHIDMVLCSILSAHSEREQQAGHQQKE